MRNSWILAACLVVPVTGCGVSELKTQRDRDIEQCAYGVVVPRNVRQRDRSHYINDIAVPSCLRAKGYADVPADE